MKFVLPILLFCFTNFAFGQDVHWSQFSDNPILLNPANSGNHAATHRFITAYKDQWRAVTKAFQTFSLSYDTRLKNPDWSIGLSFLNDKVGDGRFKTYEFCVNPSYSIPITKAKDHSISTGLLIGMNHRQFDFNEFYFDEQYNGVTFDASLPITEDLQTDRKTNLSLGAGFVYKFIQKDGSILNLSCAAFNLNQANQGFYGVKNKRDVRMALSANYKLVLSEKLHVLPSILFQNQGAFKETVFGTNVKYLLQPTKFQAFQLGIFYRMRDAVIFRIGVDYKNWNCGVSYDINNSSLVPASNKRGGIELNLSYLIYKFKPKKVQYRVCPDFI